ncbi:SDR family oxidoreductase [Tropicimonas sp. IMCC34043]|uniref:SDR family NAD(P)-dependent oxidoreductase n=1 Tax=Tropicimonas sp. IMCC34043 TaxID=2248760 RepID=UPI000E221A86|nr:SDR family NAD(P)-dependent oxidoreductase [Tropicimonas sp. IMCC34043]
MFAGKTWWIVGASDGLGEAIAEALDAEKATLLLSARSGDKLGRLAGRLGDARALPMDVTDAGSVAQAVAAAGKVDGLIYSAGYYAPMTAAAWEPEGAARMAEVNFTGALRLLGHVVPQMVRDGQGRLMLIGSLSGFAGLPGAIGYAASKAAIMHLAEDMLADLRGTGVIVQRANPGYIRTRLTAKNDFSMPQIMEPAEAARQVVAALRSGRFSTSYPVPFAWVFRLGALLPPRLFQRLILGKARRSGTAK